MKPTLNAASWKMKKIAIVTTTNVWRRVRNAISPTGTAISAAMIPHSGNSANEGQPPPTCRCWHSSASA